MTAMMNFSIAMMSYIADFLSSEPIIYLYGMILFLVIVKVILMFITPSFWKGGKY